MKGSIYIITTFICLATLFSCGKSDPKEEPEHKTREKATVLKDRIIHSDVMDMDIKYSIWLPPEYKEDGSYPVLYLLHGYEFMEADAKDAHNGWLSKGNLNIKASEYVWDGGVPFIIVTPNGQNAFYKDDNDSRQLKYGTFFLEEFIPQIEKQYGGNGKRAIAGLSMGGYGTLYHTLLNPSKWTYAYGCSPAIMDLEKMVKSCDKSKLPGITLETGIDDTTVSLQSVTHFSDVLKENGINHELITRNGGHTWPFWQACLPKILKKTGESFR